MKKIEFDIIRDNSYYDEINEILAEEEMDSLMKIKYVKYPDLFHSLEEDGIEPPIIVIGKDRSNERIVGVGACTIFVYGIGYLNCFRIRKEYRNKVKFSEAYKKLIEESRKCGVREIVTTILEENRPAEKILTRRRKNMPIYEFYKNINFYSIKNKNRDSKRVEDSEEINYENMKISIKKKRNKIYIAEDYKKIYSFFYKIRKIISFFGYPELPEKGEKFDFLYVEITPCEKNKNKSWEKEYENAIKYIQKYGFDCKFFMIGTYENSYEDSILKKYRTFRYKSRLYRVYYEEYTDKDMEKTCSENIGYENTVLRNSLPEKEISFKFWDL